MSGKLLALLHISIFSTVLPAMHTDQYHIQKHDFTSPVKNNDLIGLYLEDNQSGVISNPIPGTEKALQEDLTRKVKARIKCINHRHNSTYLPKKLAQIYAELPAGNSPARVRKERYQKSDRTVVKELLSAAAAIAQLSDDKELQEKINPAIRELRQTIATNPEVLNPVPHTIQQLFAQQSSSAQADSKEDQENIPPMAAHGQLSSSSSSSNSSSSSSSSLMQGHDNPACAAYSGSSSSSPANSSSSSAPTKPTKKRKSAATEPEKERNVLTEKWQENERLKTKRKLEKVNTQNTADLTNSSVEKERKKVTKKWQKAGQSNPKVTDFFNAGKPKQ